MIPLTTYTCGINCEWRGGECSDTTYNIHNVALKLRHHLQHTHVALKLQVLKLQVKWSAATPLTTYTVALTASGGEGSAVTPLTTHTCGVKTATPLTTYTCGVKTASEGECSYTTYNTHVVLKLQVKGSAATPLTTYTCGGKTASEGECSDTTYNIHMWH